MDSRTSSTAILLLLIAAFTPVCAYKILMVPLAGKSHVYSFSAIAQGLAGRGHTVSLFIGDGVQSYGESLKNRTGINLIRYRDSLDGTPVDYDAIFDNTTRLAMETKSDMKVLGPIIRQQVHDGCTIWTMHNDEVLERLQKENFDIAVMHGLFLFNCIYLIPHRLQIPWITYTDTVDPLLVRTPWLPSFVPTTIIPFTESMTFSQRLKNFVAVFGFSLIYPIIAPPPPEGMIEKYQKYGEFRCLDELVFRSVLWLYTKDSVVDYPRPMMPNMVEVGGLTVKPSSGKLPPDIKKFVEGAKNGVILVSFGSAAASFPVVIAEKFISAFRQLDGYRVIWRMKNTDRLEIPDNLMISSWLPQNDLLAHPVVKLFITHSGNNGQYEAMYQGVPMIGFPITGDQNYNAKRLDHKGFGISMDLYDFTADQLLDNVHKILGDKSYKDRVAKASEIFRSQPQSPVERATFWIEHVCRFGGDHLRSAGNDLPLYSYLMLDVLAVILIALHILVYLIYRVLWFLLWKLCGPAPPEKTSGKIDASKKTK